MQFVVIGAGGTASHLIPVLVRMVPNESVIHVWDGDTVEVANLSRQMFDPHEVGKPKAFAWHERYPNFVQPHDDYVGPTELKRAIKDGDTVFICADNMAVRRAVAARAAELDNVVIINGGNEKSTGSAQLHIRIDGTNITPRITYHSPEIHIEDPDLSELSCAEIAVLPGGEQTTLANMSVATAMLQCYQRIDMDWTKRNWTKLTFDIYGAYQGSDVRMTGDDWA